MKKKITPEIRKVLLESDFYYEVNSLKEGLNYIKTHLKGNEVPDVFLVGFPKLFNLNQKPLRILSKS